MALVRGPFNFKWGANSLFNVSEVAFDYTVDTNDTTTLDGKTYSIQTGTSAIATLTLLDNDIASLATILPQYYVPAGGTLSTGQTVGDPSGSIDVAAAACNTNPIFNQLDIYACGTNAEVLRIPRARTQIDAVDIADGLRTVSVSFVGEPTGNGAAVQFLRDNESYVS